MRMGLRKGPPPPAFAPPPRLYNEALDGTVCVCGGGGGNAWRSRASRTQKRSEDGLRTEVCGRSLSHGGGGLVVRHGGCAVFVGLPVGPGVSSGVLGGGGVGRRGGGKASRPTVRAAFPAGLDRAWCAGRGGGGQGCIRREGASEAAPEAVRQAVGGGCRSGWGRLLSVMKAFRAGTWRQGDSGWAQAGHPEVGGGGHLPPLPMHPLGGGGVHEGLYSSGLPGAAFLCISQVMCVCSVPTTTAVPPTATPSHLAKQSTGHAHVTP